MSGSARVQLIARRAPRRRLLAAALLGLLAGGAAFAGPREAADAVRVEHLQEVVRRFANLAPRVPGSPGGEATARLIQAAFQEYGLTEVREHRFLVPIPTPRDSVLQVGPRLFDLASLTPNLVRLSAVSRDGARGPLVYAGDGELPHYRGATLEHAIVVLDFNCGQRWLDAALLGADAIIFVANGQPIDRGEASRKLLNVPLDVPRFFLADDSFRALAASAGAGWPARPFRLPDVLLAAQADWRVAEGVNVLGLLEGSDPQLKRECLVVTASYDSGSVVQERAPGAEQAAGVATLLEAVRVLAAERPQRSILFVALDGHCQALAGARALADVFRRPRTREKWEVARQHVKEQNERRLERLRGLRDGPRDARLTAEEQAVYEVELAREIALAEQDAQLAESFYERFDFTLAIALDLSSGSRRVGVFHAGHFYGENNLTRFLSPLGKLLAGYGDQAGLQGTVQDCINPEKDRNWDNWVPDLFATDAEPFTQAARPAVSLFTIDDARPRVDTPDDTPDRVRFDALLPQAKAAVAVLAGAASDRELVTGGLRRLRRLPYKYEPCEGMVYEFERKKTFLPNTPVPHALLAIKNAASSMMGVRPDIFQMADVRGDFRIVGYADDATLKLDAYAMAPGSGEIVYAPDLGPEGEVKYPRDTKGRQGLRRPLLLFPCQALNLLDLVDERYFETLQQIFVYDARTDSEPRTFGYELPVHSPPAKITGTVSASYVEPVAVIYAPRETRVKVTMGMGLLGLRLILTNATEQQPEGTGFDAAASHRVVRTSYQAASDMWVIDDARMKRQKGFGISSVRLDDLHGKAKGWLDEARTAAEQKDWQKHLAAARAAWAYEARAYPDVQGTEADTIKGVLFYLALLLPFAFFVERLVWGSPRIKDQIARTVGVFLIVYLCLRYVHPAFQLLDTPWIILLGFIIMTLASLVIAIVSRRFNEELVSLQQAVSGQHSADVSRAGTLGAAFALGISNMRRRPLRTALTAVTLTLLTFTVLSFTSVRSSLRANARPTGGRAVYPGMLVRDPVWSALEAPTARILANQFAEQGLVVSRSWLVSALLDKQMKLAVRNGTATWAEERGQTAVALPAEPAPLTLNAVLGLSAREPEVSGLGGQLRAGRWFRPGEANVCVLPASVAKKLDLGPDSSAARAGLGYGAVEVFGSRFEVVGVIADQQLTAVTDLDGEPLTPVDFSQLEPEKLRMLTEQQAQKLKLGSVAPPPIDRYTHYAADTMIVLPVERLMALGGTLRSVAMRFQDPAAVQPAAAALMDRFELSAYAASASEVALYSSIGMTSVSGLETVLIPLIIAALIVLNTMLGAVIERLREIGIFSSIGLAPAHVAMLFLAESCVFANLGVIIGYLLGQTIARLLFYAQSHGLNWLLGLSLNYSSTAAVGVAIIIIATVLLSTIYPARKAARLATPDVERRWRLPLPDGHLMKLRLPFMLTGRDGIACNVFLKEYFDSYVDFPGGDFYTDGTTLARGEDGSLRLSLTVWLAPYDLGVSQRVILVTTPDPEDPLVNAVDIHLERISGDDNAWRRTNWLFVNILRQQFLIWRTVSPAQKASYAEQGLAHLGEAAAPAGD